MVKNINICSLLQAANSLESSVFNQFLMHYGIEIKSAEIADLGYLAEIVLAQDKNINIFNQFYVGYKIPQIGKEFDLLRFGKEFIINVELKRTSTVDKVQAQLIKNKYYLGFVGLDVRCFTFVADSKKLFSLDDEQCLCEVEFEYLLGFLKNQEVKEFHKIDDLFNPSNYLTSPFNSTEKFIKNEYFLTHQQEEVEVNIVKVLQSASAIKFISLTGSPGTGKTLLVYDVVKKFMGLNKKSLIIHCGNLNEGQEKLNQNGWEIISIRDYFNKDLATYDLIVIDEAQRIYPRQLDDIVKKVTVAKNGCIFSFDKFQTLSRQERVADIGVKINSISSIISYSLSEKIRTNREIATFITSLFNSNKNIPLSAAENIELNFFNNIEDAKIYLSTLDLTTWEVLQFTPSIYNKEQHEEYWDASKKTSHKVIGQEFDGVAVVIDQNFSYDTNGELIYRSSVYYDPAKMLFQNITRARKKLNLIIINNQELLSRCLTILR